MNMRQPIRLLAVSFTAFALLLFSTVVVSDWDCRNAADDAKCLYCHLNHQAPAKPEIARCVTVFEIVASVPLPEDATPISLPVLSETPPRAPPAV
jgi:hypothetical protein